MHSRIFQTSKEPISEDKYFDEGKYYGGFVEQVADYVMESNRDDDLDWLRRAYEGRGIEKACQLLFRTRKKEKYST